MLTIRGSSPILGIGSVTVHGEVGENAPISERFGAEAPNSSGSPQSSGARTFT